MKKVSLLTATLIALVAFTGLSTTALAVSDPGCDQYGNEMGIFEFEMDTPDSDRAGAVSNVTGSGYTCGSDLTSTGGNDTLFNHADFTIPPGVKISDPEAIGVPVGSESNPDGGSFAGTVGTHILSYVWGGPLFMDGRSDFEDGIPNTMRAFDKAKCRSERDNEIVGDVPQGEIVSCLKGSNPVSENYSWTTLVSQNPDRYTFTIGPMHGYWWSGAESGPGFTYINLDLCGYFGGTDPVDPGDSDCGESGDQFQQKNGDASYPTWSKGRTCFNRWRWAGRGIYTLTATNMAGETTASATSCVLWNKKPGLKPCGKEAISYDCAPIKKRSRKGRR